VLYFLHLLPSRALNLAFAAIAAAVLVWTTYVLTRPDSEMISYLNDDAFYYLVPAHSFANGEGWTFDRITRTSGFQPLYGYVAALLALGTGYTRALPSVMTLTSAVALLAGVWLLLSRTGGLYGAGIAAAATGLTIASPRAFLQITAGLEWGWAVMITSWLVWSLTLRTPSLSMVATAAFLTVITRIDLSIFVAIYATAAALSRWREKAISARDARWLVGAAATGAAAGVIVTGLNSWLITGRPVPNSVAMKEFWSRTNEFLPAISWNLIVSSTGPGAILSWLIDTLELRSALVIGVFFAIAGLVCLKEWRNGPERRALAVASALTVAAYTIAYARGVNMIADHYSAPVVVPMALILCGALAASRRRWPAVAGILAVSTAMLAATGHWQGSPAHLVIARHAGPLFATVPVGARVAAWNAGIAGWRTGKRVINLDGLANASVVEPIRSGTLVCYLTDNRISHIMDFGFMFAGEIDTGFSGDEASRRRMLVARNGYDPATLYRCLTLKVTADDDALPASRYRLFEVDQRCTARLCERTE
jgi:hypothetical protein